VRHLTEGDLSTMAYYRPAWAPDAVDLETPSTARMYDYYLGGSHNFAADRHLAEAALKAWPETPYMCRANRAFLRRAVTYLAEQGIDQFLDLGSGIPTSGNVHEIAQAVHPDARTVYVDSDAVAYAHGRALLEDDPQATYLQADLRDPDAVLASPSRDRIPRPEPTGGGADADDAALRPGQRRPQGHRRRVPRGGGARQLLRLQPRHQRVPAADTGGITKVYTQASHGIVPRDRAHIQELADGWELLEPGLVDVILWRPDAAELDDDPLGGDVTRYSTFAAVGRSPA
jgi:hypothetical protein